MSGDGHVWWDDAVVYEVYPRSFADADGDGTGDLPGLRSRLPHLADLGVDAIGDSLELGNPRHAFNVDRMNRKDRRGQPVPGNSNRLSTRHTSKAARQCKARLTR